MQNYEFESFDPPSLAYEVSPKKLEKMMARIQKYGKMIDPSEIIEGQEYLQIIQCHICKKIPPTLTIRECC